MDLTSTRKEFEENIKNFLGNNNKFVEEISSILEHKVETNENSLTCVKIIDGSKLMFLSETMIMVGPTTFRLLRNAYLAAGADIPLEYLDEFLKIHAKYNKSVFLVINTVFTSIESLNKDNSIINYIEGFKDNYSKTFKNVLVNPRAYGQENDHIELADHNNLTIAKGLKLTLDVKRSRKNFESLLVISVALDESDSEE